MINFNFVINFIRKNLLFIIISTIGIFLFSNIFFRLVDSFEYESKILNISINNKYNRKDVETIILSNEKPKVDNIEDFIALYDENLYGLGEIAFDKYILLGDKSIFFEEDSKEDFILGLNNYKLGEEKVSINHKDYKIIRKKDESLIDLYKKLDLDENKGIVFVNSSNYQNFIEKEDSELIEKIINHSLIFGNDRSKIDELNEFFGEKDIFFRAAESRPNFILFYMIPLMLANFIAMLTSLELILKNNLIEMNRYISIYKIYGLNKKTIVLTIFIMLAIISTSVLLLGKKLNSLNFYFILPLVVTNIYLIISLLYYKKKKSLK